MKTRPCQPLAGSAGESCVNVDAGKRVVGVMVFPTPARAVPAVAQPCGDLDSTGSACALASMTRSHPLTRKESSLLGIYISGCSQ